MIGRVPEGNPVRGDEILCPYCETTLRKQGWKMGSVIWKCDGCERIWEWLEWMKQWHPRFEEPPSRIRLLRDG